MATVSVGFDAEATPPTDAEMTVVAVPLWPSIAVASPLDPELLDIVATDGAEENHCASLVTSNVSAFENVAVA